MASSRRGLRVVAAAAALLLVVAAVSGQTASSGPTASSGLTAASGQTASSTRMTTTAAAPASAATTAAAAFAAPAAAATATTPTLTATSVGPPAPPAGHGSHGGQVGGGHRAAWNAGAKHCPNRCVCFKTIVRCMFLQLDHVPRAPADTTVLDLRFNKIRDIPANAFKDLRNLHTLVLNNNHLVRLQNGMFNGLSELRYLFLYKNRIRDIDSKAFRGVPKLEQLYLHYNELEKIAPDTFSAVPTLQRLYLHSNKIDRIPGMAFLELRNLERLLLHNNRIQTIPASAFRNLQSLKRIRLDNNLLVCDCNVLWLSRVLRERGPQAVATCASPPALQGRAVADLREADFHCSKPRIVKEPEDVQLDYVGPVYFKCQAEGDPQPRIVWLKEGGDELSPSDPGYEFMSDGTLMVEAPSMDPVGAYACMAKSAMGEAKSRVARLVTNKRRERPDITRPPRDWQVAPGDTVTLDCRAVGTPPPLVSWSHNGRPVAHSPRSLIATDGTLVLTGLRVEEAGEYRCTASNSVGSSSASAKVVINATISIPRVAPRISSRPSDLTVKAGGTVLLRCRVDGSPRPAVTWFKDGRTVTGGSPRTTISNTGEELRVEHAKEADSGLYVCRAENSVGTSEAAARITVQQSQQGQQGLQEPQGQPLRRGGRGRVRLVHHPFNMEAMLGTSVEIPCSAEADQGEPLLSWRKDGQSVTLGPRLRVSRVGSLRIYNLTLEDAGLYECIATDGAEEVSAKGVLAVRGDAAAAAAGRGASAAPGDQFVRQAFAEATLAVDRAVNATINAFQQAERNHATLYRAIRFPDESARTVARPADVFEKTLINIRRHVEAGIKMNVTQDFNYTELLSPRQLQLVANLSGCMAHRPAVNCTDMCFHLKFRTVDGTCNNLQHPMWGASLTGFRRVLRPQYENGLSTPIGWNKNLKYHGFPKPSARLVSTSIIKTDSITPDPSITHMVMQWGQFLDHDLDHAIPSETSTSWDGIDCKKSCDYAAPCYPIEVPPGDPRVNNRRCIDFIRSSAICGSGQTSVLFEGMQPREQINQLTAFVDASQVYGFSDEQSRALRNLTNEWGRLREGTAYSFSDKPYLPFPNPGDAMDCRRDPAESDIRCFLAGDIRANEQVGLLAMHTIWFREHNRVAGALRAVNPHWDGDTLYHEARKIVGAQVQHITFQHWLPTVLGAKGMEMMGPYTGYDPTVNPGISNAFATAALRFGHSLINPQLHRLNESFLPIPEGHLPLGKAFFSPWRLVVEGGVDPLLRGLIHTPAKLKTPSENLNSELTEQLFTVAHAVALDLAAINIQRGRDHGLPEYNAYRERCGLRAAETFDDLRGEISSQAVRDKLRELYGHPGNVDLWVGGILEDTVEGAKVGPTFRCLLVEQFKRLRDGDRFYYENPSVFKPEQLTQIRLTTLARVLCDNGDNLKRMQRDVFRLDKAENMLSCETWDLPRLDFRFWAECCQDCRTAGQFSGLGRTFYRGVRRYRRELNEPQPGASPARWQHEDEDALNEALDVGLGLGLEDDIGEERIEGLETAIESFQKAVRQLRRKLRRLEGRCSKDRGGRAPPQGGDGEGLGGAAAGP